MARSLPIFDKLTLIGLMLFAIGIPFSLVPPQFGIAFACLGWLGKRIKEGFRISYRHTFFIPYAIYLTWNLLASALSLRPLHSVLAFFDNEWASLIMVTMVLSVERERELKWLVYGFLCSAAAAFLYGLWQTSTGTDPLAGRALYEEAPGIFRAVGFHGFWLTYAALVMIGVFLSLGLLLFSSNRREVAAYATMLIVGTATLFATYARSMWLALGAGVSTLGFIKGREIGLVVLGALVVILVVLYSTVPSISQRMSSIIDPAQNPGRIQIWTHSMAIVRANPIMGIGQDNFDLVYPIFKGGPAESWETHTHNDYLSVLMSSGIIGLGAFMWMWAVALRSGFRAIRKATSKKVKGIALGATLSLIGFLTGALFQNYYGTFLNFMEWWFVVGLMLTAERISVRDDDILPAQMSS